jgi:hypothetical protein
VRFVTSQAFAARRGQNYRLLSTPTAASALHPVRFTEDSNNQGIKLHIENSKIFARHLDLQQVNSARCDHWFVAGFYKTLVCRD